jgi:hypothetical protein
VRQYTRALYAARLGEHLETDVAMRQAGLAVLRHRRKAELVGHSATWAVFAASDDRG